MTPESKVASSDTSPHTPEAEGRHHSYRSSVIPWYVHLIWVGFWILAIIYIFSFLVPKMRVEVFNPP